MVMVVDAGMAGSVALPAVSSSSSPCVAGRGVRAPRSVSVVPSGKGLCASSRSKLGPVAVRAQSQESRGFGSEGNDTGTKGGMSLLMHLGALKNLCLEKCHKYVGSC